MNKLGVLAAAVAMSGALLSANTSTVKAQTVISSSAVGDDFPQTEGFWEAAREANLAGSRGAIVGAAGGAVFGLPVGAAKGTVAGYAAGLAGWAYDRLSDSPAPLPRPDDALDLP